MLVDVGKIFVFRKVLYELIVSTLSLPKKLYTCTTFDHNFGKIFTSQRYASVVCAVIVCPSVRPYTCICLSVGHMSAL